MKKTIFLLVPAILLHITGMACEICGCGIGNNYIGILPEFNKNIFGFRYRYNAMRTHLGVGGASTYLTTADEYRTVEAWGAINLSRNFRLMTSVPYGFDYRSNQAKTTQKNGPGDISVSGFFQLIHSRQTVLSRALLVQSLWIGGGIKLATGKYNPVDKGNTAESANLFQLGTGSTDFNVTAMYDVRLQDLGINLTGSYKINTGNRYEYRYGNKASGSAQIYYKLKTAKRWSVSPNFGILAESGRRDRDRGLPVDVSGGQLLMGTAGVEMIFHSLALGANFQTPLSQRLAKGIVRADNRLMIHMAVSF